MTISFSSLKRTIVLSAILAFVISCSQKTSVASNTPPPPPPPPEEPYTGPKISYTSDIAPIMERSCSPCHYPAQNGRKKPFDTYDATKKGLKDILYRVQLDEGHFRHMPKNDKPDLTAAEIEMLKNWSKSGFAES